MAMAQGPKRNADGAPIGRRALLGMLGVGAAGLAAAPYLQRGWEGVLGSASQLDPTGLTGLLPNPGGFRYYSVVGSVPRKDETNYELRLDGLVDRPKTYTLSDLRALPQTRVVHDVLCTDGWRVDKTPFEGVKLADLLDDAGVHSRGRRSGSPVSTAPTARASRWSRPAVPTCWWR